MSYYKKQGQDSKKR